MEGKTKELSFSCFFFFFLSVSSSSWPKTLVSEEVLSVLLTRVLYVCVYVFLSFMSDFFC